MFNTGKLDDLVLEQAAKELVVPTETISEVSYESAKSDLERPTLDPDNISDVQGDLEEEQDMVPDEEQVLSSRDLISRAPKSTKSAGSKRSIFSLNSRKSQKIDLKRQEDEVSQIFETKS